jgi:hypothetical protein
MKIYGGVEAQLHAFLNFVIRCGWVVSFTPSKEPPDTKWIGVQEGLIANMDTNCFYPLQLRVHL